MADSELKRKTASGLLWSGLGIGSVQVLSLLFGIFLSRILSPADYGIVGSLTIFIALAGLLCESGFMVALINKRDVTLRDYSSIFWFNILLGVVCYAILFALAPAISRFYRQPEMIPLLRFLSVGFIIGASTTAPTAYLLRSLKVKQRSFAIITASVVSGIVSLVCAFMGMGYWSLAILNVSYLAVTAVMIWIQTPWHPTMTFSTECIRSLLPFSLKQLGVMFFYHLNSNIFPLLLGRFYGMASTGYFTQGNKWTATGTQTLRNTIDAVAQPVIRQTVDDPERTKRVFAKLLRFTAFLSIPCLLGLGLVAREIIVLTVTDKWLPSVSVMQILCVGAAFTPITGIYGNLFNSIDRPDIYMWNTIIPGIMQLAALCVTYPFGLDTMLVVYVAINILWLIVWQFYGRRHIGLSWATFAAAILPYLAVTAVALGVAWYATLTIGSPLLSLCAKIAIAAGIYVLIMWRLRSDVFHEALAYLRKKSSV